ncbi:MAG: N-acetylmuramoyl-L-alanine amidase [Muribaculaceae bacterium]|nr:N-acetylmuramoyl-L-alanine amidase [Muribaculaceae bacterium]
MKRIFLFIMLAAVAAAGFQAQAKRMSDLKIYINPGHGGYTGNDRPIQLYPFAQNDTLGYWESKSNLYKGLHMYHILDSLGATPYLSRIKNTEADDRSLSGIAEEANKLGVDLFFSIHSNAGEDVNYPIMLYREETLGHARYPENITISNILGKNLYSNQLPVWTNPLQVEGDLTFYLGVYKTGLGVLRTLYTVGLLSEGGMHEHRPEAYRLMNDDYWWLEAWHFVRSIMEYFDTEDRFVTGNIAGIVYDDNNLREKDMPVIFHNYERDRFAPVNGCLVELLDKQGNLVQKRTTDNMYNGVFVFRNVAPGDYTLRTTHDEYYASETSVTVKANEVTYNDLPLMMRREYPLEILSYSPVVAEGELVSCATTIEFDFNSDIDTEAFEKAFSITPAVEGRFIYSKNLHHASFVPESSFTQSTEYTVRLDKSACTPDRNYSHPGMNEDWQIVFTTRSRDRVELIDQFPAPGGQVHYVSPNVEFRFDNVISSSGIYDLISITDSKGNVLPVNKRECKVNKLSNSYGNVVFAFTKNLEVGETYTVRLSGELRDREQLPMGKDVEYTFTGVDVTADVPEYTPDFDFELNAPFEYNAEHSHGIAAATPGCKVSTAAKIAGKSSALFNYAFQESHDGETVWLYKADEPLLIDSGDEIAMYVNGDFNNHELYVGVTSGTDIKWIKLTDLNYLGWKHCSATVDLDASFTYMLAGFKLVQTDSRITQKGSFYVDDLVIRRNGAAETVEIDAADIDGAVYDLHGRRVAGTPATGIYLLRTVKGVRKVAVR